MAFFVDVGHVEGDRQDEIRSLFQFAPDLDSAAHHLDQCPRDVKAQPRLAQVVGRGKGFEDIFQARRLDPQARIGDGEL